MLSYVVAVAKNNVIGKEGNLAWHLPDDLKKFKEITNSGSKTMIMGRKTFESLHKLLPGRKHIILTRNKDFNVDGDNVLIIHSIDALKPYIESEKEYYVIGGGEIFNILMPYTKRIYLTIIHQDFEGDTYFPEIKKDEWKEVERREGTVDEKNVYKHTYVTLERK